MQAYLASACWALLSCKQFISELMTFSSEYKWSSKQYIYNQVRAEDLLYFGHCFALFHVHSVHAFASRCHASSQLHRILSTGKIIIEWSVKQFSPTFKYCIGFTVLPRILVSVSSPTELAFLRSSCWRRNSASRFYTKKIIPIIFTNIFFKCSTINTSHSAW